MNYPATSGRSINPKKQKQDTPQAAGKLTQKRLKNTTTENYQNYDYYHTTRRGPIAKIEENDSFRFIENRKDFYYINTHSKSLSVDTPKDIEKVEEYIRNNEKN